MSDQLYVPMSILRYTLDRALGGPWASLGVVASTKSLLRRELPVQSAAGLFKNAATRLQFLYTTFSINFWISDSKSERGQNVTLACCCHLQKRVRISTTINGHWINYAVGNNPHWIHAPNAIILARRLIRDCTTSPETYLLYYNWGGGGGEETRN